MKIVVTGAAGFVGSNLVNELCSRQHSVTGLDDLSVGTKTNLDEVIGGKNFSFKKQDVTKASAIKHAKNAEIIIHEAAAKIPKDGTAMRTLLVNTEGTKTMLEAARRNDSKFVFASTSDVYGKGDKIPFNEESDLVMGPPTVIRWSYAISKMFDEQLILSYAQTYGLKTTILRYFNSYGPRGAMSWRSGPQTVFIDSCLRGVPITIHGDGKQKRCFTYIDDLVNGTLLATFSKNADGQVFNIGNGSTEITILDLAKLIMELSNKQVPLQFISFQKAFGKYEDVKQRVPDLTKAKKLLGYAPKIGLREGLSRTISWQKKLPQYA